MGQYVQNPDGTHSQQSVLTGRKLKFQRQRILPTSVIAAGGTSSINIFATPGFIARLKFAGAYMPAIAAATGNQTITIGIGGTGYGAEQLATSVGTNGALVTAKYDSSSNIPFDSSTPLQIAFSNLSDKPTDGTTARMYVVIYEEEAITL